MSSIRFIPEAIPLLPQSVIQKVLGVISTLTNILLKVGVEPVSKT